MRIAILADPIDDQTAGIHTYVRELVNALFTLETHHEFYIVKKYPDPKIDLQNQVLVGNKFKLGRFDPIRKFYSIPKVLKEKKIDLVFEPAHFGPFNLPASIKRVTMIHDLTPISHPKLHPFLSSFLQRMFLKRILSKVDLILANSKNTAKDIGHYMPSFKSKIETIPLGLDPIYRPEGERGYLESRGIQSPYFLFVGTLEPRKNLSTLLRAFTLYKKAVKDDTRLIIVGQVGWKAKPILNKIEQHPFRESIVKTDFIEKKYLPELYSHSLALIYPSVYEGFGLPVLEALACGTNVISANNSSLPEVGGHLAYYFDTLNPAALFELMAEVALQNKETMRRRKEAPGYASRFSWENYAKRFVELMQGV